MQMQFKIFKFRSRLFFKSKYPSKNGRKDKVLEFYDYMVKSKANMLIYYIAKINTTIVK